MNSGMNFLLCLIVIALGVVESEVCGERGMLRPSQFNFGTKCNDNNCFTIQVCENITGSLEWINICFDSYWNLNSINVYCRQFGYSGAKNVSDIDIEGVYRSIKTHGQWENKIYKVKCIGNENDIISCKYGRFDRYKCPYPLFNLSGQCFNQTDSSMNAFSSTHTTSSSSPLPFILTSSAVKTEPALLDSTVTSAPFSSYVSLSTYAIQATTTSPLPSASPNIVIPQPSLTPVSNTIIKSPILSATSYIKPTPIMSDVVSMSLSPTFPSGIGTSTSFSSGSDTSTSIPSSIYTSTSIPSSIYTSTSIPSSNDTSTSIPSGIYTSTSIPPGSDTSTSFPSGSDTSTSFPSGSDTSTSIPSDSNTDFPSIPFYISDDTKTSPIPSDNSDTSTSKSTSTSTSVQLVTQESRVSMMLIPILAPIVVIVAILIILTIVIMVISFIFFSRKKGKKLPRDYETPMCTDSTGLTTLSRQVDSENLIINGDTNFYTTINESTLMDQDDTYAEIGLRTLESEYVQENPVPICDHYSLLGTGSYEVFVEGEVGDSSVYERLPVMDYQGYHKLVAISDLLENPLYDSNTSHNDPIYIEPPSSLPQLETVFGQCLNEIRRKEIQMGEEFASGQFGVVYRAVYHSERGDIPVAIKTLKEAANEDTKVAFMREAAILAQFQHPNVLRMIGVLTAQQPYMMVTELLKTELADFLSKMKESEPTHRHNLPPLLLRFSREIAAGMNHLSKKHFIHRDLAARNVLVAKDLSCRIADFGMSRELHADSEYYTSSGGRIPLRWTAPEAVFYQKYSEKSDVWSFGMTMFEIWSLGDKPWGLYASNDEIIQGMCDCKKLSPPTGCPRDVYRVMVETWRADASFRPTFSDVQAMLSGIQLPLPIPGIDHPSRCLGNDPLLAKDHYLDLQTIQ